MTNLHESYLAGNGFDITNPGLKTDYRSAALPTALWGPLNMRACMYAYMCACLNMRVCMRATDGRDGQRMENWVDLHVYMCVRACLRACDHVCEDGMIDTRSDG